MDKTDKTLNAWSIQVVQEYFPNLNYRQAQEIVWTLTGFPYSLHPSKTPRQMLENQLRADLNRIISKIADGVNLIQQLQNTQQEFTSLCQDNQKALQTALRHHGF